MSTQPAPSVDETAVPDSEIEAEVSWTVGNRPPEVVLSFQGLYEPTALFDELRAIGWDVPGMPPRPANAIEWTPDPVAGTDFTVLPWTVQEFRLGEGEWTVAADEVGTRTLDALLNNNAEIIGTSEQIAEHAASYAARASKPIPDAPVASAAAQPAAAVAEAALPIPDAARAPQTASTEAAPTEEQREVPDVVPATGLAFRSIILLGFAASEDPLPGAGRWVGVSGRQKVQVAWNEHSIATDQPIPGHQAMGALVAGGAQAWYAETAVPLAEVAPDGQRIVRLVVPGMSTKDAKIRRLHKVLGDNLEMFELRSLVGANESAVLVSAVIGAHAFDMLMSNLTLRMPNAIVRTAA